MKHLFRISFLLLSASLLAEKETVIEADNPTAETDAITVVWQEVETYRDIDEALGLADTGKIRKELETFIQREGERHLPEGATMTIEVLEVDLAGRFEGFRSRFHDVRIVRDPYWPAFTFAYTVRDESGAEVKAGEESVWGFRGTSGFRSRSYPHERALIRTFFKRVF